MQKRHADRQLYFNEQSITTQKYVIPFIEKHKPITADSHILEIGCGEGGNIKPFLDLGCQVTGIDINGGQIAIAKEIYSVHPNNRNLTLICEDIYKVTELHNKFDIIIIRDVIEHIPNQELFLPFIKRFLSPHGIIFVAFPPWQNPFGGHQQICNNKLLSHLPWFHLLPRPVYKKVLEWGNVNPGGLLEIKDTGISLERFLSIVHKEKYRIVEEVLYFINPNYETKFNLRPRRLWRFLNIPYIRNFYTTCGYYILTYIIHSGFISGYQNRYGDNLKPPTNVYHRMTA